MKTYMSSIAFHLKINNLPDTTKTFIIQKFLVGLSRKQPFVDVRRPITLELLHRIIQVLQSTCKSSYESTLFTSAYLLAYFGFLRVGELAITSDASQDRVLQFSAVSFANSSIQLFFKFSKTDQDGKGATIVIPIDKLWKFLFPLDHLHLVHFFAISIKSLSHLTNSQQYLQRH